MRNPCVSSSPRLRMSPPPGTGQYPKFESCGRAIPSGTQTVAAQDHNPHVPVRRMTSTSPQVGHRTMAAPRGNVTDWPHAEQLITLSVATKAA